MDKEAIAGVIFRAINGADADPFQSPEAWEFAETIATAILALQSSERGEGNWPTEAEWNAHTEADRAAFLRSHYATLSPAEPSPESREGIIEECAKVAEEYPSLEYADIAVVRGIASAIRALSAPAHD